MTYRTLMLSAVMFILLTAISANLAHGQQYVFRSIDMPGAGSTYSFGSNNNSGAIAACYQITGYLSEYVGYLLAEGAFKPVNYPKAAGTCLYGVSNDGKIAGVYIDTSGTVHGFLLVGKKYTSISYAGATQTLANGVNNSGVVAGYYLDSGNNAHGFTWQSGTFTSIDFPGASGTYIFGINDSGAVVGEYVLSGVHGFLLTGGTYTTLDYPGATNGTAADGTNNAGEIVGFYEGGDRVNHAFTYVSGTFANLDYPGSAGSALLGINDEGQAVGMWYTDVYSEGGKYGDGHGYLATPLPGTHDAVRGSALGRKGLTPQH